MEKLLSKESIIKKSIYNFPIIRGVYFLISRTEQIVYIGKSNNCYYRIKTHKTNNSKDFARYYIIEISDNRINLEKTEKSYINNFKPFYNKKDNPDRDRFTSIVRIKRGKNNYGGRPKGMSQKLKDASEMVIKLYVDEMELIPNICEQAGLAPNSVYRVLKTNNIPLRIVRNRIAK